MKASSFSLSLAVFVGLTLLAEEAEGICFSKHFYRYFCYSTWYGHNSCFFMRYQRPFCFGDDRDVQRTLIADKTVMGPRGERGHVIPLSDNMGHFDLDGNGFLEKGEFGQALGLDSNAINAPFIIADINADGKLSEDEFNTAPFLKERDVNSLRRGNYYEEEGQLSQPTGPRASHLQQLIKEKQALPYNPDQIVEGVSTNNQEPLLEDILDAGEDDSRQKNVVVEEPVESSNVEKQNEKPTENKPEESVEAEKAKPEDQNNKNKEAKEQGEQKEQGGEKKQGEQEHGEQKEQGEQKEKKEEQKSDENIKDLKEEEKKPEKIQTEKEKKEHKQNEEETKKEEEPAATEPAVTEIPSEDATVEAGHDQLKGRNPKILATHASVTQQETAGNQKPTLSPTAAT